MKLLLIASLFLLPAYAFAQSTNTPAPQAATTTTTSAVSDTHPPAGITVLKYIYSW